MGLVMGMQYSKGLCVKSITQDASICLNGRQLPVNNADGKSLGCFVPILWRLENQMTAVLSHHSRMWVVRFDLHCNEFVEDNQLISRFMKQLMRRLPKDYARLGRTGYLWARETGSVCGKTHYHLVLLLNGNAICSAKHLTSICKELWQIDAGQGQVQTNWEDARVVKRSDNAAFADAFYWFSYLAKVYTKGQRKPTANDYSSSQIKHKVIAGASQPYIVETANHRAMCMNG